ncbi:hypothetical protein CNMCM6069_002815 [Aspergillus lentulus]|nr:hypothetical protein CNMCM6069_002815 [Aspergillus lentulus]
MVKSKIPLNKIPKDFPEDQPVFMLSLLQWNDQAEYPEGSSHPPCSGQEAWVGRFVREISKLATETGNFEWVYQGLPLSRIIGGEKWDLVALVKFANIGTFRNTVGSDSFAPAVLEHRDAALKNWKLLFFTSPGSNSHGALPSAGKADINPEDFVWSEISNNKTEPIPGSSTRGHLWLHIVAAY